MNNQVEKTIQDRSFQAVFVGSSYEDRKYDGALIKGNYYSRADLRETTNKFYKKIHLRILKLIKNRDYCFEDAPLSQEIDREDVIFYYDFPVPEKWLTLF